MQISKVTSLIVFTLLVAIIWGALSLLTGTLDDSWYLSLKKPIWLPPEWALELIWLILYTLIALSGWRVWNKLGGLSFDEKLFNKLMIPYWSQLIIDLAWSILFFGMHQPLLAAADIIILLLLIWATIISFSYVDKIAALMLLPYFIWVSYATSLSIAFVSLN